MTFSYMKLGTFFKDKHSETCIRTTSIIQKKKSKKKKHLPNRTTNQHACMSQGWEAIIFHIWVIIKEINKQKAGKKKTRIPNNTCNNNVQVFYIIIESQTINHNKK